MTTNNKFRKGSPEASGRDLGIMAVFAAVVCCGLPVLIGAGALAAVGGVLRRTSVVATAIVLVVAAVAYYARRWRRDAAACCVPAADGTIDASIRTEDE